MSEHEPVNSEGKARKYTSDIPYWQENFAATTKDDELIATVVFRPDEGTVTVIDNRKDQPLQ